MKRILFSIAILGMAASAAIADVSLTVVHSKDASFQEEIKTQAAEQNVEVTEVTHLTVICEEGAVLKEGDLVGANTTTTAEQAKFIRTASFFKNNLVKADFSQAVFENNTLTGSYYDGDKGMLSGCLALQEVILPEGLETISGGSFKNCAKLVTVKLPESTKTIGVNAFRDCPEITFTSLPASLERIGDNAFASTNGNNLQANVKIGEFPAGVKYIEPNAFNNTNVYFSEFPDGIKQIGDKAFRNTQVSFSTIPSSIETLGTAVFVNCSKITYFIIPEILWESIPNQTFYVDRAIVSPRTFICRSVNVPAAAFDDKNYTGAFGNASSFSNVTIYVPFNAVDDYKSDTMFGKMNVQPLKFDEAKSLDDLFTINCEATASPALEVKEVVGDEEFDLNFDREGVYRLRFTPNSDENSLTYISRIYFANEDNSPADVRALANAMPKPGDVLYSASDGVSQHVWVDVPVFADSPKLVVELKVGTTVGVSEINSDTDQYKYVYNISGICVAKGENVDMSALPSGTYIVKSAKSVIKVIK